MSTWIRLLTAALLAGAGVSAASSPAYADCPDPPLKSEHAFTGTVTATERDGLVAHVTTDRGEKVVVNGAESETGVSSVDRTYQVGARYEFHPRNGRSPYQDNACTATRQLSGGAAMRAAGELRAPAPGGVDWTSGPMLAGYAGLVLLVGAAGAWAARRARRRVAS